MSKIVKRSEIEDTLDLQKQVDLKDSGDVMVPALSRNVLRKEERDATTYGRAILDDAKKEAMRIKKEAEKLLSRVGEELEKTRKKGFKEGHEEGMALVSEMMVQAKKIQEDFAATIEKDVIRLVYDIAEKVIGEDLSSRDAAIVGLVKQTLKASQGQKIVILVNPIDYEVVKANHADLLSVLDHSSSIQIRSDEKVKPKGCIVESEVGTIDAQLENQLKAIRKALGLGEIC
ncbi:MAG: hypothetical protein A3G32_01575 [Deltaproteobacteria bacterium RIFCSPLOWO2_12_FULL_40_28]|nr:MAG: hypothetical protein A3C45_06320 [Deltaproteobacteria bacterium RIFCSPHIGHO2_02_FULL_40_28]OGQ18822.1 MAG: hypothetical protein A3E27_08955 [Deltaproteobacteria bacterium RIFCSPHIGHO2_12_FULL_40_32]OGQ40067.1 MAG: hypothetical protein A3I69_01485 [Deltaproteobacteria bacterium RIFCSPLOWO2_02_FULL_40_36]OGQ53250.1 MAG: hypothetical protein A3G32_01575 [Deltaproteobacteria bacterium RIFCSPLOWO2_12_FULL_40_28]